MSCDRDLSNFQLELKSVSDGVTGGVGHSPHLDKIANLEKRILDSNTRLDCWSAAMAVRVHRSSVREIVDWTLLHLAILDQVLLWPDKILI